MKLVSLKTLPVEPNSHNPKITKKVLVRNGQVPRLTNLTQAIFPPGEIVNPHTHQDMYEIFFVEKGLGVIKINDQPHPIEEGTCITVELGDKHEIINSSNNDLVITYLGIEI